MKTTDITLAATLRTIGYPLQDLYTEGRRGYFVFENIPTHEIDAYEMGRLLVEPTAFHNNVKQLSEIIKKRIIANE